MRLARSLLCACLLALALAAPAGAHRSPRCRSKPWQPAAAARWHPTPCRPPGPGCASWRRRHGGGRRGRRGLDPRRDRPVRRRDRRRRLLRLLRRPHPPGLHDRRPGDRAGGGHLEPVRRPLDRQAAAVPDRGDQRPLGRRAGHADDLAARPRAVGQIQRWPTTCRPAEQVASSGFPVDADAASRRTARTPSGSTSSAPPARCSSRAGNCRAVGSIMRNPDLARTYALIGRDGIGALYGGPIGRDVVSTVHDLPLAPGATLMPRPGAMTLDDLRGLPGPVPRPDPRRLPGLRRLRDGPVVERRHDGR